MALDQSEQHARFQVEGMTCASCVIRVQKAIEKVPGVKSAAVNLATETANVEFAPDVSPEAIAEAITSAGYKTVEEEAKLSIEGMTCASCVGRVEKALKATPGVRDAAVNLPAFKANQRPFRGPIDGGITPARGGL